jgi:DnaJ domain
MNLNSPLFDKIRTRRKAEEASAPSRKGGCEHVGCNKAGDYRAPKGRASEGQYWNFCLEHVKAYNQTYNYFVGMTDDAIARYQKDSVVGHRPTWSMGTNSRGGHAQIRPDQAATDVFDLFGGDGPKNRKAAAEAPRRPALGPLAMKSLERLGLDETADGETIKNRFKSLVKQLHPDVNGGDRATEDQLREIIDAYNTLKASGLA